jgi:glycosyltransferase involved in cell wall biosynthesis
LNQNVAVVIIGRNEGERLRNCLMSIKENRVGTFVYVDSGSTDNSLEIADSLGAHIVHLNRDIPFSAGRARNEGFNYLVEQYKDLKYVQFVDGDCVLDSDWMKEGVRFLEENHDYVIAAGQRKEFYPERSVYNLLCDLEWNTPVGDAEACGGDFVVKVQPFKEVEGFNPIVIAGEEPDLCYRLRQKGGRIRRIDHIMTYHDAAITKFSQWWKRAKRTGHAYGQGYDLHKEDKSGYYKGERRKILQWSLVLPLIVILASLLIHPLCLAGFFLYGVRLVKIYRYVVSRYGKGRASFLYSWFVSISCFPQLGGLLLYYKRKFKKRDMEIIEYE